MLRSAIWSALSLLIGLAIQPSVSQAFSLVEIAQISPTAYDVLVFGDSDHDGKNEVFVYWRDQSFNFTCRIYEEQGGNTYTQEFIGPDCIPLALGDVDSDGKTDMIAQAGSQLQVYESPSVTSYPNQLVWSLATSNFIGIISLADTDRDDLKEIIHFKRTGAFSMRLVIYECTGDNTYEEVFSMPTHEAGDPVVGDFDKDELVEIAYCGYQTPTPQLSIMTVVESPSDNIWGVTFEGLSGFKSGGEGEGGRDTDGNGQVELFFSGLFNTPTDDYRAAAVFESIGDNQYQRVAFLSFDDESTGYTPSALGNLDGVGREEYIMAGGRDLFVYRPVAPGQWTLVGTITDPSQFPIHESPFLMDVNQNGIPELFWPTSASDDEATLVLEQNGVPTSVTPWEPPTSQLAIAPNPCRKAAALVHLSNGDAITWLAVYDVAGRLMERRPVVRDSQGRYPWTPGSGAAGVYYLRLEDALQKPIASGRVTVVR